MEKGSFGKTTDGETVEIFTLRNAKRMAVRLASYGATVVSVEVPDRNGKTGDVVLGFDGLDGYLGKHPHFGGVVGRYGNRIAHGRFSLRVYQTILRPEQTPTHLP